jgi:LPXTG-site transpeptidase (sortase) family protein
MNKIKIKVTIGVFLVIIGLGIISWNYLLQKRNQVYETMYYEIASLPSYIESDDISEEPIVNDITSSSDNGSSSNKGSSSIKVTEGYLGRLMIPKINFNRGFYKIDSKYNDVNINIQVMKGSSYPDVARGNFIIAGHSGNVWYSFFKNLYKLKVGNVAYVTYKNEKYTYKLVDIYEVKKTGTVTVKRKKSKSVMTLITCTKNSKTMQTIYIFEQVKE